MNDSKLARLPEVLKDPVRQKILLLLGEHDRLIFKELLEKLEIHDKEELKNQLKVLRALVKRVKEHEYFENGVLIKPPLKYVLTDQGHFFLDEMIAFPELKFDDYKERLPANYRRPPKYIDESQ
jgi:predicted ArsR family transcriptional regulator